MPFFCPFRATAAQIHRCNSIRFVVAEPFCRQPVRAETPRPVLQTLGRSPHSAPVCLYAYAQGQQSCLHSHGSPAGRQCCCEDLKCVSPVFSAPLHSFRTSWKNARQHRHFAHWCASAPAVADALHDVIGLTVNDGFMRVLKNLPFGRAVVQLLFCL